MTEPTRSEQLPAGATPLDGVDAVLADLDGVVYRGEHSIRNAVESLLRVGAERTAGGTRMPVGYITNNASRTDESVAEHLRHLGLDATAHDVVTSAQAAARLLVDLVPAGSDVLVVGGEGLMVEVQRAGLNPVTKATDATSAVVQGFSPEVGWPQLAEAAFALQGEHAERPWVATNNDWTIPVARGVAPGNGTLVSAVHTAVGRFPVFAGKPETPIFTAALERFNVSSALVVGDRLDTDILGANRSGLRSALVLTGIDGARQLLAADPRMRPSVVLADLGEMHVPYPVIERGDDGTVRVRDAVVRVDGRSVRLVQAGELNDSAQFADLVRAASVAVWSTGVSVHGLDVAGDLLDALRIAR
jgi:glycerol-1-phosphatase